MQMIPADILEQYSAVLKKRAVPISRYADYGKWLQYFLDFRSKYPLPEPKSEQVRLFIQKLREKKQSIEQQKQAAHALSLFFESQPPKKGVSITLTSSTTPRSSAQSSDSGDLVQASVPPPSAGKRFNEWHCLAKSKSPAWDKVIDTLAAEIKTRHYSRKTLKTYADWIRKFQCFLHNKLPEEWSETDVKSYLTYLAVNCKVAASTQNQAFNSLLFLYRHILKKDFGDHKDIPSAKKSKYIPVVLSRKEIDAVLKHLSHPYNLVVKLLYGCGLRLFECVKLRVKNFNFDAGILTLHGKGSKDRTVPIPQTIMPELTTQFEAIKKLYDEDIASGYAGVFLEDQLEKKYPKAAKDFIWQWFFPQQSLTFVADTKEKRRYHVHEKHVQEALYEAVRRAKLTKRVTSHTFRHSFATLIFKRICSTI